MNLVRYSYCRSQGLEDMFPKPDSDTRLTSDIPVTGTARSHQAAATPHHWRFPKLLWVQKWREQHSSSLHVHSTAFYDGTVALAPKWLARVFRILPRQRACGFLHRTAALDSSPPHPPYPVAQHRTIWLGHYSINVSMFPGFAVDILCMPLPKIPR